MSPELETLDQLLGGELPLSVVRRFFRDDAQFVLGVSALCHVGEVNLIAPDGSRLLPWQIDDLFRSKAAIDGYQVEITEKGALRIG